MKIDLSTVILVILCVIPGLFAQRSRNSVCPRSFDDQGASAELGELVALGISTHGFLVCIAALGIVLGGLLLHYDPLFFFHIIDAWSPAQWASSHSSEAAAALTAYVFLSFSVSHWMGLLYGIWGLQRSPITTRLLRNQTWLKRKGVPGLLGERPLVYEGLTPNVDKDGVPYQVFIELQMKNDGGFYSGQLKKFAIVKDEDPHKQILLFEPYFKKLSGDAYVAIEADSLMLDLADVSVLLVKQLPRTKTR